MEHVTTAKNHNFIMENRKKAILSGVLDVVSFSDCEISLFTELGELKIKGKDLKIIKVSTGSGDMEFVGEIDAISYGNKIEKIPNNFITKLFR